MSAFKYLGVAVFTLILSAFLVAPAQAQSSCNVYNWNPSCPSGLLNVFVQVENNAPGVFHYPHEFQISVQGQSPNPSSFMGSQNGTPVQLLPGAYSVSVSNNPFGYIMTSSNACSGAILAGQTQTCVVTFTATTSYPYPTPAYPPLICAPQFQSAALGQAVNFYASGGTGSYNWSMSDRSFTNIGPKLSTGFTRSGVQNVTVTSGIQSAICTINIAGGYVPNPFYPPAPPALYASPAPRLPNTGVEPMSAAGIAFAALLLGGTAFALRRHVREALAATVS
ncbi:hypothetical protein A2852_02795 [Candidatus Adlerbacteria bacterium RIFCSPHIGHO2_01_FULL_54_23]|uniref:SpaA-like prealbumin fold domain-containing protein n=3 Tax=Candidatus Adleribacteriota TaxID=1752736 RepID=A0A1F4XZY6_9BACT|nr:MAG: hypothetical protein UY83_C0006G0032 [Candidatus Adlerbacteria bacterium GW2011_GWA1_54_10]KKW37696.1 MAG: hypothetical protein UY86_C0004G0025 [Candidatus Adlerbacteria bacterium GW2011_GWB1_54_7]OGC79520.1 MAG: hypothetical protein A2852_02795 [Candidatus Adlerbacteria bacterium RIFCSPHIGHO2_01_FULL_54_23]OGC87168.1 MAG: hypothetical protein A3B33_01155 [Candidatus Adlerbacteria bacterium RIFCSPLOWO2_01_FULL_54_16]